MIIDSYDITSEPIIKLENFYGEKQHLVKKCMVVFSKVMIIYFPIQKNIVPNSALML